jgi:hypothetical protein
MRTDDGGGHRVRVDPVLAALDAFAKLVHVRLP